MSRLRARTSLTFDELRLASMLNPVGSEASTLAQTLADVVIHVDRVAALNDIDLAAAIRRRFDPVEKVLHDVTPSQSPTGEGEDKPYEK